VKLLVINGPNMNFLGIREPQIYGNAGLEEINARIGEEARKLGHETSFFQSNSEGAIIDAFQQAYRDGVDGIILNPGAYTHTSYAIHDAIKSVSISTVEVHLSNIHGREEFRSRSVTAPACLGQIGGLGAYGYILALYALDHHLAGKGL
jgi:3-dehydroquinate dehydratase-2